MSIPFLALAPRIPLVYDVPYEAAPGVCQDCTDCSDASDSSDSSDISDGGELEA